MNILGISSGHDSSAAIIVDGNIIAAASEERFTRIKNDSSFPLNAIDYCLRQAGLTSEELDAIAFPDVRLPKEFGIFFDLSKHENDRSGSIALIKRRFKDELKKYLGIRDMQSGDLPIYQPQYKLSKKCAFHLCEHHLAHAASAYYTSGNHAGDSMIVTMDGLGGVVSSAIWKASGTNIVPFRKYGREGSLGWFYGNATEGLGWRHGSDEWKVMGLAPYGAEQPGLFDGFHPEYADGELIRPHDYGRFGRWNDHGAVHWHSNDAIKLAELASKISREDYAAEVQRVVEEQSMALIIPWLKKLNVVDVSCAGGAFLNIKLNQRIWNSGLVERQWIYPDAGDAGLAVGAALHNYYTAHPQAEIRKINNLYWGPEYSDQEIAAALTERGLVYEQVHNPAESVARHLAENHAIGWFQGRMEAGPRALGARSILMSPLHAENKDRINAKVKYRESFRPFCPSILREAASEYLINYRDEPFMITSFDGTPDARKRIPAVVHVDGTVRPQLVAEDTNKKYYDVIKAFGVLTGEFAVMNTSFNVKGEPVVCSPRDAIRCFFDTGLDVLSIGSFIVKKPTI